MAISRYYDETTQEWTPLVQGLPGPVGPEGPPGPTGPGMYAMPEGGVVPPDLPEGTIVFTY